MTSTMTSMTFDVMAAVLLLALLSPAGTTHFRGAHFWFDPADDWTPNRTAVS